MANRSLHATNTAVQSVGVNAFAGTGSALGQFIRIGNRCMVTGFLDGTSNFQINGPAMHFTISLPIPWSGVDAPAGVASWVSSNATISASGSISPVSGPANVAEIIIHANILVAGNIPSTATYQFMYSV